MIYKNNVLKQILVDGGYIAFSGPAHYYYYYLKDHLGNNRVVVSPSGAPLQVNHYYPFGGLFGESTGNSLQRFRFNGKEFDRTHGLDWYDYGARHMSPDVGRFTSIDPMAEKYYSISPYAYCGNNPVNAIDIKGDSILVLIAPKGANGNGHLAALIQNSEGKWEYYSKNGTKDFFGLYGKPYNDNKGESSFTSVIEFLNNSDYNPIDEETNQSKYTEGYLIPTTSEEDVEAINAAKSELNKNYNVIGSNCAVTVQSALSAAGKKTGNPDDFRMFGNKDSFTSIVDYYIRSKVPNIIYKAIKSQNNGKVIKPSKK